MPSFISLLICLPLVVVILSCNKAVINEQQFMGSWHPNTRVTNLESPPFLQWLRFYRTQTQPWYNHQKGKNARELAFLHCTRSCRTGNATLSSWFMNTTLVFPFPFADQIRISSSPCGGCLLINVLFPPRSILHDRNSASKIDALMKFSYARGHFEFQSLNCNESYFVLSTILTG